MLQLGRLGGSLLVSASGGSLGVLVIRTGTLKVVITLCTKSLYILPFLLGTANIKGGLTALLLLSILLCSKSITKGMMIILHMDKQIMSVQNLRTNG